MKFCIRLISLLSRWTKWILNNRNNSDTMELKLLTILHSRYFNIIFLTIELFLHNVKLRYNLCEIHGGAIQLSRHKRRGKKFRDTWFRCSMIRKRDTNPWFLNRGVSKESKKLVTRSPRESFQCSRSKILGDSQSVARKLSSWNMEWTCLVTSSNELNCASLELSSQIVP